MGTENGPIFIQIFFYCHSGRFSGEQQRGKFETAKFFSSQMKWVSYDFFSWRGSIVPPSGIDPADAAAGADRPLPIHVGTGMCHTERVFLHNMIMVKFYHCFEPHLFRRKMSFAHFRQTILCQCCTFIRLTYSIILCLNFFLNADKNGNFSD